MAEKPAEHICVKAKPNDALDIKKLDGMFKLFLETTQQAHASLQSCQAIGTGHPEEILPGVFAISLGEPKFEGLHFCKHCMLDAALSLRDLADICEDIVKEGEKHAVQE